MTEKRIHDLPTAPHDLIDELWVTSGGIALAKRRERGRKHDRRTIHGVGQTIRDHEVHFGDGG